MKSRYFLLFSSLVLCLTWSFGDTKQQTINANRRLVGGHESAASQTVDSSKRSLKTDDDKTGVHKETVQQSEDLTIAKTATPAKDDSKNSPKTQSKEQTNKDEEMNAESIEKYHLINKKQFSELCSNQKLNKMNVHTIYQVGDHFVLTLDDQKLAFKIRMNEANKYYPKLTKIPYRCTSYCEAVANKSSAISTDYTINRLKYDKYLIEILTEKDYQLFTFYLEYPEHLEDANSSNHLIQALTFTIENNGCTLPVKNPNIEKAHTDNLVTQSLINMLCNEQLREQLKKHNQFVIHEHDGEGKSLYKIRHATFFTYPIAVSYNLTNKLQKDTKLEKNNLANTVQNIRNAVQANKGDELFITFNDEYMNVLQKQETQLVDRPPHYTLQNFYGCPQPLCLDPYFDDLVIVNSCVLYTLFNFLPKASRFLIAFRGNYLYLINEDTMNVPKIEYAIPIEYLFKEILKRPDINFTHIDAAEYVAKSEVMIMFEDDKYVLVDPRKRIVNGPFKIVDTFKTAEPIVGTVLMDDHEFIMIQKKKIRKYSWTASQLSGRRDIILDEFITLIDTADLKDNDFIVDAAYRDGDSFYVFVDDNFAEMKVNSKADQIVLKETAKDFFKNCDVQSSSKRSAIKLAKERKDLTKKFETIYLLLKPTKGEIIGRQGVTANDTVDEEGNSTTSNIGITISKNPNGSYSFHPNQLLQLLVIVLFLMNILQKI